MLMTQIGHGYPRGFLQEAAVKKEHLPCQHSLSAETTITIASLESCCPQPLRPSSGLARHFGNDCISCPCSHYSGCL